MRTVEVSEITKVIRDLCINANYHLPKDIQDQMQHQFAIEPFQTAKNVLGDLLENVTAGAQENLPLCQDTGMAVVFLNIGQDVHLVGGNLSKAVDEGVRQGYEEGFLRKSVVRDPLNRVNTKDNTPAVLHIRIVPGDKVEITVAPKGFGSENMSRLTMLKPADGVQGMKEFVLETVRLAGPNPCPPIVVGVGVGGTFDKVTLLAKEALLRPINESNPDPFYASLEKELLEEINQLGIGPQGFGGLTTALGVNICYYPTHIAGLPVAVNINCHVTRHGSAVL